MRIAVVTGHFSELHSSNEFDLCRALAGMGQQVFLICSDNPSRLSSEMGASFRAGSALSNGFQVIRLPTPFEVKGTPLMLGLHRTLDEVDPDVIHTQEYFRFHSLSAQRVAQLLGVPYVITQHRYLLPSGWLGILFSVGNFTVWRQVVHASSGFTAISEASKSLLTSSFDIPSDYVTVIPHPVDTQVFTPRSNCDWLDNEISSRDGYVILTVSRLRPFKNIHSLVRIMPGILRVMPSTKLVIVGSGEEEMRIKALVARLNLAKSIFLISRYVDYHTEMPLAYASADLFALPTLQDVLPISLLEAMSSGLPVVASAVGGIPDVVRNGSDGYIVMPGDLPTLKDRILQILKDDKLRTDMARYARATALEKFDMKVVAKKTFRVYQRALARN